MRGQPVLVVAIHDFPTERGTLYPHSQITSDVHERQEGCAFIILNKEYGGQYLAKKKPNDYGTGIPLHEMEALARVLLPEIQKFFESEEGQKEFRAWKEQQKKE